MNSKNNQNPEKLEHIPLVVVIGVVVVITVVVVVYCGLLYEFYFILFLYFFQNYFQDDEGEKSDQDLVVDVANEMVS